MTLDKAMVDLIFRLSIGVAGITGSFLFFGKRGAWMRYSHLIFGVLAFVLCCITGALK